MTDPVFNSLLIHTCTVEQRVLSSTDDFGQPVYSFVDESTGVPCRLQSILSSSNMDAEYLGARKGGDGAFQAVISSYKFWIKYSQDLDSTNRITDVRDKSGNLLDEAKDEDNQQALTFRVRTLTNPGGQSHHKMGYVELVTGVQQ